MSILDFFRNLIGKRPKSGSRKYEISESLQVTLTTIAQHEGRPEHEILPDILAAGLPQYISQEGLWTKWESLTPREQDVVAFVCLGYTNRQIAARISISTETVKDRLESAYRKFNVKKRADLRMIFAGWDFSAWEDQR